MALIFDGSIWPLSFKIFVSTHTLTISPITYTPNSNFASGGYEFGTFGDGNSDHDFVIRGGIVWETFS